MRTRPVGLNESFGAGIESSAIALTAHSEVAKIASKVFFIAGCVVVDFHFSGNHAGVNMLCISWERREEEL